MKKPSRVNISGRQSALTTRKAWTDEEDELVKKHAPNIKEIMRLIPGRTHASIACRWQKLQNKANPSRTKIAENGTARCQHSKRRSEASRLQKINGSANVTSSGVFVKVHNLVQRAISTIIQEAKARDHQRQYFQKNKQVYNSNKRKRRKTDDAYRMKMILRTRFGTYLHNKGVGKSGKTAELLKMSYGDFVSYLGGLKREDEDLRHMEIDHIFPITRYNILDPSEMAKFQHFSNFQPLTKYENIWKKDRLPTKEMASRVKLENWPSGVTESMLPDRYYGWSTALRM